MNHFGLIVIGAHTGQYLDDIINSYQNKKILLVEPVPYNYQKLHEKYSNRKNFFISQNAVLDVSKNEKFYFVKKNSINKLGKHWATGIGSFNKEHILNHKSKRFKIEDGDIDTKDIKFLTFDDLIDEYQIKSIDRLQLDIEGAEYKILKSINFKKMEINEIFFESKHFDGTFSEGKKLEEIKDVLKINGYNLEKIDSENILAKKIISD